MYNSLMRAISPLTQTLLLVQFHPCPHSPPQIQISQSVLSSAVYYPSFMSYHVDGSRHDLKLPPMSKQYELQNRFTWRQRNNRQLFATSTTFSERRLATRARAFHPVDGRLDNLKLSTIHARHSIWDTDPSHNHSWFPVALNMSSSSSVLKAIFGSASKPNAFTDYLSTFSSGDYVLCKLHQDSQFAPIIAQLITLTLLSRQNKLTVTTISKSFPMIVYN